VITVVGGTYAESCLSPYWNFVYGSGGRAAVLLGTRVPVDFFTLIHPSFADDFATVCAGSQITLHDKESPVDVQFEYEHPLSFPSINPPMVPQDKRALLNVTGDKVLAFGMLEADIIIEGKLVIYDPQSGRSPRLFSKNGSKAQELVYVLNATELALLGKGINSEEKARWIFDKEPNVSAVLEKNGPLGVSVHTRSGVPIHVPAYRSRRVFKIGSGDVFSSSFTYYFAVEKISLLDAVRCASMVVANYVESRELALPNSGDLLTSSRPIAKGYPKQIYLAGPFFSTEQRWLVDQMYSMLEMLGGKVFSPFHHVGLVESGNTEAVVTKDLEGLDASKSMVAILNGNDPGTIFEIGYAVALGKEISVLAERSLASDLTMMVGNRRCSIFTDLTSTAYNAIWDSLSDD
jgi:nucleoside 2-deoxyribosyltransferase